MTALVLAVGNTDKWVFGEWLGRDVNQDKIIAATREHIVLTVAAVVIGLVIAIPASILVVRFPRLKAAVLGVAGAVYTIPSLALYGLLVPYLGLTYRTALVPLVLYTLLILVRNTVTGLEQVPAEVRDAADGMGMSRRQRRWKVEMPLALPSIMAGIRIATVSTIGMLTIAALVGLGGLGKLILSGLTLPMRTAVTVGVVLSVGLAVIADVGLAYLGRRLTPWTRRSRRRRGAEGDEAAEPVAEVAVLPDGAVAA